MLAYPKPYILLHFSDSAPQETMACMTLITNSNAS